MVVVDKPELLTRVKFPTYSVQMISPRHLVVGGGGGAAKTGVINGFEVLELSHNGLHTTSEPVTLHTTGDFSVMNFCSTWFDPQKQQCLLAAGHEGRTQVMSLQLVRERQISVSLPPGSPDSSEEQEDDKDGGGGDSKSEIRKRRKSSSTIADAASNGGVNSRKSKPDAEFAPKAGITNTTTLVFSVKNLKSIQTDFSAGRDGPFQKVVRVSPDGKFLASGGEDGVLRVWTFPDLNAVHECKGHEKEKAIDDIDFSPDNTKIATISKDRRALVWDVKKGKKHAEMGWEPSGPYPKGQRVKYCFKRVRFAKVEGDPKKYRVFTIANPVGGGSRPPPSFLQRWNAKSWTVEHQVSSGSDGALSALAVSDNGNYVATGAMFEGIVEVYIAFSLQKIKRVEKSHSTFITGLEFLPCGEESDAVRGFSDASVVSISVDRQVCIHHVPRLQTISLTFAAFLLVALLLLTFFFCTYIGL